MIEIPGGWIVALIAWMLTQTAALAVGCYQLNRLMNNHLPHIKGQLNELLRGEGMVCRQHEKQLTDHETRIREVED